MSQYESIVFNCIMKMMTFSKSPPADIIILRVGGLAPSKSLGHWVAEGFDLVNSEISKHDAPLA